MNIIAIGLAIIIAYIALLFGYANSRLKYNSGNVFNDYQRGGAEKERKEEGTEGTNNSEQMGDLDGLFKVITDHLSNNNSTEAVNEECTYVKLLTDNNSARARGLDFVDNGNFTSYIDSYLNTSNSTQEIKDKVTNALSDVDAVMDAVLQKGLLTAPVVKARGCNVSIPENQCSRCPIYGLSLLVKITLVSRMINNDEVLRMKKLTELSLLHSGACFPSDIVLAEKIADYISKQ